ncbi:Uncharacterised protein [Clostridioides difficile]|nr:Uncharacterised protein [Clostridioides difficile]VFG80173.1 Uncharacterised protein [Clostridioides difficile]VFH03876.1 Uncharacterised protein [Clostridioides difficile]VIB43412.1 Uncharacterised protein [Clostridioides difficile]VIB68900.1 Uncharacterised protein [Clostridioides difficile]
MLKNLLSVLNNFILTKWYVKKAKAVLSTNIAPILY